jgi:hypothetical protein
MSPVVAAPSPGHAAATGRALPILLRRRAAPGPHNDQKDNQCHAATAKRGSDSSPLHCLGSHRAPGRSTPAATHPS